MEDVRPPSFIFFCPVSDGGWGRLFFPKVAQRAATVQRIVIQFRSTLRARVFLVRAISLVGAMGPPQLACSFQATPPAALVVRARRNSTPHIVPQVARVVAHQSGAPALPAVEIRALAPSTLSQEEQFV